MSDEQMWEAGDLVPEPTPLSRPIYTVLHVEPEGEGMVRLTWAYQSPNVLLDGFSLVPLEGKWQGITGAEWLAQFRKV